MGSRAQSPLAAARRRHDNAPLASTPSWQSRWQRWTKHDVTAGSDDQLMRRAGELIREAVMAWPGVEAVPHRFGGVEYRYGRKEMGHVHGDRLADLPLPRKLRDELIGAGRAEPHHVLPGTGWVSCWMNGPDDAAG